MTEKWKEWDDESADKAYDACSWNDICSENHEIKWQDCQQVIEVSRIQQNVTSIFEIWISHENKKQLKEKEKDRIVWKWSKREQNAALKVIAKHQDQEWIETSHEYWQSFSRNAKVDDWNHNDRKKLSDDCHDHQERKKFIVHVVNMMQSEWNQHHHDVIDHIETEYEVMMQEYKHHICWVKQQMIIECN